MTYLCRNSLDVHEIARDFEARVWSCCMSSFQCTRGVTVNRHCCSAPVMAQPGVFRSFFGVEGSAFLEIHGINCRILWAVLDLARSFERSSSPGENFCGSSRVPWSIQAQVSVRCDSQGRGSPTWPGGFWPDVYFLPWDFVSFWIMSDGVGVAQHRKLWCPKWISLVVWRCSYMPAT